MMIDEIRNKIKNKTLKESNIIIDTSPLELKEKYQLMRELYSMKHLEFDVAFHKSNLTVEDWIKEDIDDYVGCIWPSDEMCDELEKYVYDDFLDNYKNSTIQLFNKPFEKVIAGTFKYDICYLILEQILNHPTSVKSFENLNKNDVWFAVQWLIYLDKLDG